MGAYPSAPMEEVLVWRSAEPDMPGEDGLDYCTGTIRIKPFVGRWCGICIGPQSTLSRGKTHIKMIHTKPVPEEYFALNLHNIIKFSFPICRNCEQRRYSRVLTSHRNHNGQKRVSPVLGHLSRQLSFLVDTEQPQWAQECF